MPGVPTAPLPLFCVRVFRIPYRCAALKHIWLLLPRCGLQATLRHACLPFWTRRALAMRCCKARSHVTRGSVLSPRHAVPRAAPRWVRCGRFIRDPACCHRVTGGTRYHYINTFCALPATRTLCATSNPTMFAGPPPAYHHVAFPSPTACTVLSLFRYRYHTTCRARAPRTPAHARFAARCSPRLPFIPAAACRTAKTSTPACILVLRHSCGYRCRCTCYG